jgi:transposase
MSAVAASVRRPLIARSPWKGADMASIPLIPPVVIGGVDTHKDLHVAAVVDTDDRVLDTASFPTTRAGYRALLAWMRGFGRVERIEVEGTGSYGAGLHRYLAGQGIEVWEVARPDRADRRRRGKNDVIDAQNAAHAARAGQRVVTAKARDGMVEALRILRTTRTAAVAAHREALQVLDAQIIAAPAELRDQVRGLSRMQLVRALACWRPAPGTPLGLEGAARTALGSLARRIRHLADELAELDELIAPLVRELAPSLLQAPGFGIHTTAQLLVTMGDNPERISTEPRFAKLCGVAPLEASSGKHERHRLNRGGDRDANSALYIVTLTRMHHDERTRDYVQRRTSEGKTKSEIIRCLKRYAAREAYYLIKHDHHHPDHIDTPA